MSEWVVVEPKDPEHGNAYTCPWVGVYHKSLHITANWDCHVKRELPDEEIIVMQLEGRDFYYKDEEIIVMQLEGRDFYYNKPDHG